MEVPSVICKHGTYCSSLEQAYRQKSLSFLNDLSLSVFFFISFVCFYNSKYFDSTVTKQKILFYSVSNTKYLANAKKEYLLA